MQNHRGPLGPAERKRQAKDLERSADRSAADSHREKSEHNARDLPEQIREEIEKFFVATDELENKELTFLGWRGPKTGEKLVDQAAKQFKKGNGRN